MNYVEPVLILPCPTPDFEANIWGAVIDNKRDWDDTEKEYLRRNQGIRESLIQWYEFMNEGEMTHPSVSASTLYRTIADVADFLERYTAVDNAAATQWGFLDNGETLEICHILLEEFRQCEAWTALEQRYESVGGNIYSPDDNEWEVV